MVALPRLPPRRADAHKGDFGRALLIGGSRGMAGAIALAGMACLRSGAGLVKLAVPQCILNTVAAFEPSYMTLPLACDDQGRISSRASNEAKEVAKDSTCIALGPGLGRSPELVSFVASIYEWLPGPMVVDADAINALAENEQGISHEGSARILTPHPGEFSRLFGFGARQRDLQVNAAKEIAAKNRLIIVLKGHRSVITDGSRVAENTSGNPGMATGGTGDVLTGIITALICQGLSPFDAAVLGAHVHGLAGDLAAADLSQISLIASDLLTYLPKAFKTLT
jgi:NAD(P)H-hydrate epimerase